MRCTHLPLPGGVAIVCSRNRPVARCRLCGRHSVALCDFKLLGRARGKTCDMPICAAHQHKHGTFEAGPNKGDSIDYCPAHHKLAQDTPELPGLG